MERISFIRLAAAGLGALALPLGISCSTAEPQPALALPKSLLAVCDSAALREIGQAYRAATPHEDKPEVLEGLISAGISPQAVSLSSEIASKIALEYSQGKWVEISGWILAPTEARQCALYSLINP